MANQHVRPPVEPLTEADARHLLAEGLLRPCQDQGPTRVALKIGCDEKTVRKARDKDTTLRLDYSWNALLANPCALDSLAAHFGLRFAPRDAVCTTDPGTLPLATLLQQIAAAEHPESHGGVRITEFEARGIPEENLLAVERLISTVRVLRKAVA